MAELKDHRKLINLHPKVAHSTGKKIGFDQKVMISRALFKPKIRSSSRKPIPINDFLA